MTEWQSDRTTDDRRQRTDDGLAVHPPRYPLLDARYCICRIERWTGEGTVFPFSLVRLERAQLQKPGAVMEACVVEKGGRDRTGTLAEVEMRPPQSVTVG